MLLGQWFGFQKGWVFLLWRAGWIDPEVVRRPVPGTTMVNHRYFDDSFPYPVISSVKSTDSIVSARKRATVCVILQYK